MRVLEGLRASDPEPIPDRPTVFLHAGQLFATADPTDVSTVLGSCVAVCLFDPVRRIGGLNHYLLPYRTSDAQTGFRLGNIAIRGLLDRVLVLGARKADLRAKVFGGASVTGARTQVTPLGWKNVEIAREQLATFDIRIVADDVGGTCARRLLFRTDRGDAFVRRV